MNTFPLKSAPMIIATALTLATATTAFATDIQVVDPISGETVSVTEIAFSTLTEDQREDVGDQLAEQGYRIRSDRSSDRSTQNRENVSVVDPTSGETVSLADIDVANLSDEDRRSIRDQLAEQGLSSGRNASNREDFADVDVVDPTSGETVSLSDVDVSSLSNEDRRAIGDQLAEQGINPGRGGKGRGGRSRN